MSTAVRSARPSLSRAGLRSFVRDRSQVPMYRNGYALVASSALTSGLGLVYWLLAAREYSTAAVGVGSALISATTTLAALGQLSLNNALNRFLPRAGGATTRLVLRSYLISLAVTGLAAVVFVAGLGIWSPRLAFLNHRLDLGGWFVLATMVGTIFILQDSVLTGIRQSVWVPLENVIYAVVKIILLVGLVAVAPFLGTFIAWTVALPLLIVPVNLLLFRRLLPAHVAATRSRQELVPARSIVRYVAGDYTAYLIQTATSGLLPLVVLGLLGPAANAYYFVSWSIAYGLYLIATGMGLSMIAEASHDPDGLSRYRRQALVETAKLVIPCVAVIALGAPWLLDLLGRGYSSAGGTLLRLLALSAIPWMVFVAFTNTARVERRMGVVVATNAAFYGLVLAIGLPLLGPLGIDGIGIGWLGAASIVAAAILGRGPMSRLGGRLLGNPPALGEDLIRAVSASRDRLRTLRHRGSANVALTEVRRRPGCADWTVRRRLALLNDVAVTAVGPPASAPVAVVKHARSGLGERSLWPAARNLLELPRVRGLGEWSVVVPRLLGSGVAGGRAFILESHLPGKTLESMLADGGEFDQLFDQAASAIGRLHDATSTADRVDAALLRELVDAPIEHLASALPSRLGRAGWLPALHRLRRRLHAELAGLPVRTARVHGDLSPTNVLMAADGTVNGIVDWDQATARGLPGLDLLQLAISMRMLVERRELGDLVSALAADPGVATARPVGDGAAAALLAENGSPAPPARTLLYLVWLKHVSGNLAKSDRYHRSRVWIERNIAPVLGPLIPEPASAGTAAVEPVPAGLGPARTAPPAPTPAGMASAGLVPAATASAATAPGFRWPTLPAVRLRSRLSSRWRELAVALSGVCAAALLWAISLPQIDPRAMTDLGLVSVLPASYLVALLLLSTSFVTTLRSRPGRTWLLVVHLLVLIAMLHATPAIVYGTVRYTWSYKHVGIVDYIARHGGVDPGIGSLAVYHNWPGFFALITVLAKLAGLPSAMSLARWGPVYNNLLYLGALLFLFGGLTRDRRVVWIACWLYFISNWVGQDYFSPQGLAFFLYLVLLGVVVRWLGPAAPTDGPGRTGALALSVALVAAIAPTHALTAVMACIALTALVLGRACRARALPLIAIAISAAWDLGPAWDFVSRSVAGTLQQIRLPWTTTSSTLVNVGQLSPDQALVADLSRLLTVGVIALAGLGVLALIRARRLDRRAAILGAAPVLLFATGNYDGELLFRIYLFAVPLLVFFAAHALLAPRRRWLSGSVMAAGIGLLSVGFLFAYYGKERLNYVTPKELVAERWVDTHAPPHTLLIDGTGNYLFAFKNYERFTYVSIATQPPSARRRILADPVGVLADWMANPAYRGAYLVLTRSQFIEVEADGVLPQGSLNAVQRALLASPQFRVVFRDRDGIVFTLVARSVPGGSGR